MVTSHNYFLFALVFNAANNLPTTAISKYTRILYYSRSIRNNSAGLTGKIDFSFDSTLLTVCREQCDENWFEDSQLI